MYVFGKNWILVFLVFVPYQLVSILLSLVAKYCIFEKS